MHVKRYSNAVFTTESIFPVSRLRAVSPFSRRVIFRRARVSLQVLSPRENKDDS